MKKRNRQSKAKIRVMLVDDHAGMREALRTTINSEPDLAVVAEADDGQNALDLFNSAVPDVVLMDGSMPGMNGIEATRQLTQLQPTARIIGLTLYEESAYLEEMIAVAREAPELSGEAARRADAALAARNAPEDFDTEAARRLFTRMIGDERMELQRKKIGS